MDILHSGHLNIIDKANKYGKVVIGLLSDKAIAEYKNLPSLSYDERYRIVSSLKNIHKIIKQDTWDYTNNLNLPNQTILFMEMTGVKECKKKQEIK